MTLLLEKMPECSRPGDRQSARPGGATGLSGGDHTSLAPFDVADLAAAERAGDVRYANTAFIAHLAQ